MTIRQEHILLTIIISLVLIVAVYAAVDYDVNNDNQITIEDIKIIFRNFGKTQNFEQEADVNKDGRINLLDLVRVTRHYGQTIQQNTTPQQNTAPVVNAGVNLIVTLPNTASLQGTATDDGLPNPPGSLTTTWTKISGPGTVSFSNANSLTTTVTFSTDGQYILELSASDGNLTSTDQVTVQVNLAAPSPNLGFLPAFPGAEGFGAVSVGGRGGRVIEVTNLNDAGTGSLRACIEATGPRTCIFKVGGTINLLKKLDIKNPYITIAGQTAPGGGILLKNDLSNSGGALGTANTNDVIIRYLKIRTGPSTVPSCCLGPLEIVYSKNIIVDHVSTSWAVDGNIDVVGSPIENVTIQWSVISEGLAFSSHEKGGHSTGSLIAGYGGATGISFHHNFFAHNNERNPRVHSLGPDSTLDVVNNVIYDPGGTPTVLTTTHASVPRLNYVKNYVKEGPDTLGTAVIFPIHMTDDYFPPMRLYLSGNYMHNRDTDVNNVVNGFLRPGDRNKGNTVNTRFAAPPVTEYPATELLIRVLPTVGASKPNRDSVDTRLVNEAINCQGLGNCPGLGIIDHPDEVGGWPVIAGGTPYTDSDKDGMSDSWEIQNGLNPNSPVTASRPLGTGDGIDDKDGDGYTNLEEFLNELADGGQTQPSSQTNNAPSVNAGQDKTITLPNTASLQGTVSDDGLPSPPALAITWTKISGPGTVSFSNVNSATTTATFSAAGAYVLRLTASDGALSSFDDVTVTVNTGSQNIDLTSGLVLHLKFDESLGTVASDSSGNALQGTVSGASWTQGKVNGALSFDGSDDYVEMIDSALFNIGSKSTFAAWIFIKEWPVSSDSWIHTIFSDEKYPPTAIWRLGSKGLESLKKRIGLNFNNGPNNDIENNNDLQLNTWHHIAVVTDSANVLFYVDGSLDTTKPYSVTPTQKSNKWRVGESETSARNFNGTIDDVRLYNRPLTPQEVLAVFTG